MARGRYPSYFADDYEKQIIGANKCDIYNPESYLPMFSARQIPSEGSRIVVWSWKDMRPLELVSGVEKAAGTIYDSEETVRKIMEQCALDPAITRDIVGKMPNVRHPSVEGRDTVMSTDLILLKSINGVASLHARSVKRERDLTERDWQKIAIEREYWRRRQIEYKLVVDTKFPAIELANLKYVMPRMEESQLPCDDATVGAIFTYLTPYVVEGVLPLAALCRMCDRGLGVDGGTALGVALHLIACRRWPVDMHQPIAPHLAVPLLKEHIENKMT